ncbi:hypothetical protein HAX54_046732 [Datura stramonium]|uniref:Uncharacterized protein n=1 Tax=Datura stramonium TaxID=4076 RepID=A0ABS8ST28_DATST|nr:hypothetical protein [Datura stramonium]
MRSQKQGREFIEGKQILNTTKINRIKSTRQASKLKGIKKERTQNNLKDSQRTKSRAYQCGNTTANGQKKVRGLSYNFVGARSTQDTPLTMKSSSTEKKLKIRTCKNKVKRRNKRLKYLGKKGQQASAITLSVLDLHRILH